MINDDTVRAATQAFGTSKQTEPWVGRKYLVGSKMLTYHKGHDLVYQAIKKVPESKNDDGLLLAVVWEDKWDYSKSLRENIMRLPRSENLTRRRRDLHLMGLIEYSPKAMSSRETAYRNERDRASPLPPQTINLAKQMQQESATALKDVYVDKVFEALEQTSLMGDKP